MTDELKSAFDRIRAEDRLKSNVTQFLSRELQRRSGSPRPAARRRLAAAMACAAILLLSGSFSYHVYSTPITYVDVDVNPSTRLTLNRFDRVIGAYVYQEDGLERIEGLAVKHKRYGAALDLLMDSMTGEGYLQSGGLVSVTLQTEDLNRETELLSRIQTGLESYLTGHHQTAQVEVFPISADVRSDSYAQGVSPAKYLAILDLIEVDPTASLEICRGHSISELKQLTQAHGRHHGASAADSAQTPASDGTSNHEEQQEPREERHENPAEPKREHEETGGIPESAQTGRHHEERPAGGHRGNGHNA